MISIEGVLAFVVTMLLVIGLYVIRWLTAKRWVPVKAKLHHLHWKSREMPKGLGYGGVNHTVRQNQCLYSFTFSSRKYYGIKTSLAPIYSMRNPIHKTIMSTIANSPDGKSVEVFAAGKRWLLLLLPLPLYVVWVNYYAIKMKDMAWSPPYIWWIFGVTVLLVVGGAIMYRINLRLIKGDDD